MKKLLFILLLVVILTNINAQTVIEQLKSVWPLTYLRITMNAKSEWPSDFEMQLYVIKKQCEAYSEYRNFDFGSLPKAIVEKIQYNTINEWSRNNKIDLSKCPESDGTRLELIKRLDCLNYEFDLDWEMVIYTTKKQVEAYKLIQ